jgi:hypothetical protein
MGMSAEESGAAGPPLGELLLSRGLITAEQLEEALADQRDSGRPLGEIFVRLGFATGPMIGQALATQQGRMLKSEYGFATGFDATSAGTDEDQREPPPVTIRSAERPKLVPTDGVPLAQAGGLRLASTPQPAVVQAPAVAAAPIGAPDDGQAVNADPLGQELVEAKAAVEASQRAQDAATAELRESVARLEADVDQASRERDEAGVQLQAAAEAHAALAGQLEHVSNQLIAAIAERDAALASSEAPDEEKAQLAAHVERLEQELAASQQAAAEAHSALAAELEQTATQLVAAIAERDAALASSEAPDEEKAQLAAHVERLEQELAASQQTATDAHAVLAAELEQMATQLIAAIAERDAALASPEAPDEGETQMTAHVERLEQELAASQQTATEALAALAERDAGLASSEARDEEKTQMAAHVERLEQELADAKAALEASQDAQDAATAELRESIARLEADVDRATRERDEADAQFRAATDALAARDAALASTDPPHEDDDRMGAQVAHLEQGLADARAAIEALQRDAVRASSASLPEAPVESSHLVFFLASGGGWTMLERPGPAPAIGVLVDMSADGGSESGSVTKVGRPPVPGTSLRCAYLV